MSIRFHCEKCGHEIDVEDHFAGKHGTCKHCGHAFYVPAHSQTTAEAPLHLRPMDADEPIGMHKRLLDAAAPLVIRPATADPHLKPKAISGPDDPAASSQDDYKIGKAGIAKHSSAGPPPFWWNAPSLLARSIARTLRTVRDWIYIVSIAALVLALYGFVLKSKVALHVGVVVAIVSNIGMLVVGTAYLLTLPFKEGIRYGLANVLIPFYAVYYWYSRWPKMKTAVRKTIGAFLPVFLAGAAYLAYEDGPKIVAAAEAELPVIEQKIDEGVKKLEVGPIKNIEGQIEKSVAPTDGETKGKTP